MRAFWYFFSIAATLLGVINLIAFGIGGHWENLVVGILDVVSGPIALLLVVTDHVKEKRRG
jgi:type IV secretory pathway VirB2 component (pilin)